MRSAKLGLISGFLLIFIGLKLLFPTQIFAFSFVSWADGYSNTTNWNRIATLSNQITSLNPVPSLTLWPGDMESSGFDSTQINGWKTAVNGGSNPGNGLSNITFPVRGNHDSANTSGWQTYFDIRAKAGSLCTTNGGTWNTTTGICTGGSIGPVNFREESEDLTYSFDYQNSHFIGVDVLGHGTAISSGQVAWMDLDLTQAESRGLTHAFIFFHGPIYCLDGHCQNTSVDAELIPVLNQHPIISASFHGHEHVQAYVHLDNSRISGLTSHAFEEFVSGGAGGPLTNYNCIAGRSDWCAGNTGNPPIPENAGYHGFVAVEVAGNNFTVKFYKMGQINPVKTYNFTNGGGSPDPSASPSRSPSSSPQISGTPSPSPSRSPSSSPQISTTPSPSQSAAPSISPSAADINNDGRVDFDDMKLVFNSWLETDRNCGLTNQYPCDVIADNKINAFDSTVLVDNWSTARPSSPPTSSPSSSPSPSAGGSPSPSASPGVGGNYIDNGICNPDLGSSAFTTNITNPYLPFSTGMANVHVLSDGTTEVQMRILNYTKQIAGADPADPVTALVLEEYETVNGTWAETSYNWFAQTNSGPLQGTVCYFGEDVCTVSENQQRPCGNGGSWEAGQPDARAGIMMPPPAYLTVDRNWLIEDAQPYGAYENALVTHINQTSGGFSNVVYIEEANGASHKRYAPGIGMIFDDGMVITSH